MDAKSGTTSIHHRSDTITCGKCGNPGKIVWDDISRLHHCEPELLGIEDPFFERLSEKSPYPIELVCRECGGVAVTAYPSTALHGRQEYN
jgi:hypothetical protein